MIRYGHSLLGLLHPAQNGPTLDSEGSFTLTINALPHCWHPST